MELFLLCVKIFCARIMDVTLGTLRTTFTVRGKTYKAGFIAFFEVFIWFSIVREALNTDTSSIWIAISYAAGYATGTIIGITISNRFVNSLISVEVISSKATPENIQKIRDDGYGVSVVNTTDNLGEDNKNILFVTLNSRNLPEFKKLIYSIDSKAFIVVNESKIVLNGFIK